MELVLVVKPNWLRNARVFWRDSRFELPLPVGHTNDINECSMHHASSQQHSDMKPQRAALEMRVTQSLRRLGYDQVHVAHLGNGHTRLTGSVPTVIDRTIVMAVARSTAGVVTVSCEVD